MNNQPKYTRGYSYTYRTTSYETSSRKNDTDPAVYAIIGALLLLFSIITALVKKLNQDEYYRNASYTLNSTNNNTYSRNISYNRNYSSEIDDDLSPYSPKKENQSSIPEVYIDIPNVLIKNSNNKELPPRYADVIRESMINYNNRVLSS